MRLSRSGGGHGASTVLMARAFPQSDFTGFDDHPASIERARNAAAEAGVAASTSFERWGRRETDPLTTTPPPLPLSTRHGRSGRRLLPMQPRDT